MVKTNSGDLLKVILEEHDEVSSQLSDLRQFWEQVDQLGQGPQYEEMGARLRQFRQQMSEHFADEERGGYLKAALHKLPQFEKQAENLRKQHSQFLDKLDSLDARLHKCEDEFHCWQDVRNEIEDFVEQLEKHEIAETAIVESAINDEIGQFD